MKLRISTVISIGMMLHGNTQDAMALVHSHDPARMRMVQSGFKKEDMLE
jgi:hypothetical protein